jgi:hypothetical protein
MDIEVIPGRYSKIDGTIKKLYEKYGLRCKGEDVERWHSFFDDYGYAETMTYVEQSLHNDAAALRAVDRIEMKLDMLQASADNMIRAFEMWV